MLLYVGSKENSQENTKIIQETDNLGLYQNAGSLWRVCVCACMCVSINF